MIKLRKDNMIVLGLSDRNVQELQKGHPIKFNLKELNMANKQTNPNLPELPDMDIIIFNGKDESSMINMFYNEIGPDTELK